MSDENDKKKLYIVCAGASSTKSEFRLVESRHLLCLRVDQPFFIFKMSKLTYERANELLRYEPDTGKIYWKVRVAQNIRIGDEAGALHREERNTYRAISIDGRLHRSHRVAWLLYYGVWPVNQIDHLNGNGLDNRPENMRDATKQENMKNQRMRCDNTSGHVGVYWKKERGKWKAQIGIDGKDKHLGYFADYDEACEAQKTAAAENGFTERHGVAV